MCLRLGFEQCTFSEQVRQSDYFTEYFKKYISKVWSGVGFGWMHGGLGVGGGVSQEKASAIVSLVQHAAVAY